MRAAFASLACAASAAFAQTSQTPQSAPAGDANATSSITITGQRIDEQLPATRPDTVVSREVIERRQSENVFDILKDVPGVGVEGGPRTTGMKFTLRGFSDNQDVLFKIDGAVKGFEKYRFGSGVLLEPELVNTITVERGPSVQSGSGALGGTISATTKSAIDLLQPGREYGALVKLGWNDNDRERLRMLAAYGRPGDFDLLAAVIERDSTDIKLADGSRLPLSATHAQSRLAKIGWYPAPRFNAELGWISYESGQQRQPYDVTGGIGFVGGVVRRSLDDATTTLRFNWDSPYGFKLRGLVSKERTHLHDEHHYLDEEGRREARICATASVVQRCDDQWRFNNRSAELFADTGFTLGAVATDLTLGLQHQDNRRDSRRTTSNETVNETQYPGGFNANLPPGDKVSSAAIAEARLRWRDFMLVPGVRFDRYTVSALDQTRLHMEEAGQAPDISFSKSQPSLGLSWQPGQGAWAVTARYNEGFRPPLVDDYFAEGSPTADRPSGRCRRTERDGNTANEEVTDPQPLYDPAGAGKPYDPALDHAPASGICGALYKPQESVSRELIVAWRPAPEGGHAWGGRLTVYRVLTRHLIESLQWIDGRVDQPGREHRRGIEFEGEYRGRRTFASLAYGRVRRSIEDAGNSTPSFDVPADSTVLTLGALFPQWQANAGWRLRHLGQRRTLADSSTPTECIGAIDADGSTTQHGTTLQDIFAAWEINRTFSLRASIDNLTNRDYCLVSSFSGAVGFRAPGRAAKLSLTARF